jgi:hypothetical protein
MRNIMLAPPLRGLSLVRHPSRIGTDKMVQGANCDVQPTTVKARRGKRATGAASITGSSAAGQMLKRFYNLATSGTIARKFIAAVSTTTPLYVADDDWNDDTPTLISGWTALDLPNAGDNTLYEEGYGAGPITFGASAKMRWSVSSKSWLYVCVESIAADDASDKANVPLRTQGEADAVYLHGLVPPSSLLQEDISGVNEIPAASDWINFEIDSSTPGVTGPGCIRVHTDGTIHAAYTVSGDLIHATSSDGGETWTTTNVNGILFPGPDVAEGYGVMSMDIDASGFVHLAYNVAVGDGNGIWYATNRSGSFQITGDAVPSVVTGTVSISVDPSNAPHIVFWDANGDGVWHSNRSPSGTWSSPTQIDDQFGTNKIHVSTAFDSTGRLHLAYSEDGNTDSVWYAVRDDAGTWSTPLEPDSSGDHLDGPVAIAVNSSGNPAIVYDNATDTDVNYIEFDGSSWGTQEVVSSLNGVSVALDFDAGDVAHVVWQSQPATQVIYNNRNGGSWGTPVAFISASEQVLGLVVEGPNRIHTGTATTNVDYYMVNHFRYYYRLTAEYDDGRLGESGPSTFVGANYDGALGPGSVRTIDLTGGTRYDMTKDVTRIHVYRTVSGAESDGTYYRVGSVDCTAGVPDSDFIDNISDADLVLNRKVLDKDKYLPPKYRTSAFWKDRFVIANLKVRDNTNEDELDHEAGGVHKNRIRFSSAFFPDIFRRDFFQDILPDGDSGSIRRVIVDPALDALFVLMENDVVALRGRPLGDLLSNMSFTPQNIANGMGTSSPLSVVYHDGRIFYWTKYGVEMIAGLQGHNITSDSVAPLWNQRDTSFPLYGERINMDLLDLVEGAVQQDERGEKIIWSYPAATLTTNNKALVLHYDVWRRRGFHGDPPFTIYSNYTVAAMSTWDGEGDRGELFGIESAAASQPWVYRLNYGFTEATGAGASVVTTGVPTMIVESGQSDMGRPDMRKAIQQIVVNGSGGGSGGPSSTAILWLEIDDGKVQPQLDSFLWPNGGFPHQITRAAPRYAIGAYVGYRLQVSNTLSGGNPPDPFELFQLAIRVRDLMTRRGVDT